MGFFPGLNPFQKKELSRHPSTAGHAPPSYLARLPFFSRIAAWSGQNLNFYRIHMLMFTIVPLIVSGIFYASNSKDSPIAYIDCLFMVVSASTVTGLNTILMADITTWQQVILFLMMTVGSTSTVSIVTIIIRRHFFRRKFEYMVAHSAEARHRVNQIGAAEGGHNVHHYDTIDPNDRTFSRTPSGTYTPLSKSTTREKDKKKKEKKLHVNMIKRIDTPVRVNQMTVGGWLSEDKDKEKKAGKEGLGLETIQSRGVVGDVITDEPEVATVHEPEEEEVVANLTKASGEDEKEKEKVAEDPVRGNTGRAIQIDEPERPRGYNLHLRRTSEPWEPEHTSIDPFPRHKTIDPHSDHHDLETSPRIGPGSPTTKYFPRSRTVEFRGEDENNELRMRRGRTGDPDRPGRRMSHASLRDPGRTFTRNDTQSNALHSGFGGFPNPITAAFGYARNRLPTTLSTPMPRTTTIQSTHSGGGGGAGFGGGSVGVKTVSYITFDAVVGRNSKFHGLTTAQQEELGGVEYRALTVLLRIVIGYWVFAQLISVLILAPWLTYSGTYRPVVDDPAVHVNPTWFVFFQVWSAYSNNGMSLVDASMVPFQKAYLLIVVMSFLILGGNTAYPVFLRFFIWLISKMVPRRSRTRETLQFLLDHPRRCFIYLFPSHQTWLLVFVLIVLNSVDWVSFLVLDIGNQEIERIPVGTRIIDGLIQAFAVRAAGFATVSLASTAPALQVLYVVMMYVAVYPIAVTIRSTNVYEEKSMGVFEDEEDDDDVEARFEKTRSPTSYIAYHARKQLAFDMWWLVLALWLICIVERHNISDAASPWITIFTIMFEVSSSYGTVGLSLGTPTKNTSLAGTLRTLSKLILCAVMIRGRHRGLPIAIDRAVLTPSELVRHGDDAASTFAGETSRTSRGGAVLRNEATVNSTSGLSTVSPRTDAQRQASSDVHLEPPKESSGEDTGSSTAGSKENDVNMNKEGWTLNNSDR